MKLQSFRYIGPQALTSMRNNGWMTLAAVLTITIALFLCSAFWLLLRNVDANATKVENEIRIVAYLDTTVTLQEDFDQLEKQIRWIGGVDEVEFVSKEDGIDTLETRFGNVDLISTLGGNNPLPDVFSITALSADYVPDIAEAVGQLAGVSTVRYGEGTVEKMLTLTEVLRKLGIGVMAMLGLAAVVLVALSIRLAILSRRKEIMVMKWVGATNAFIRWPFFLEGILLGLIGALLALGLSLALYAPGAEWVASTISFLQVLPLEQVWLSTLLFNLAAGLILGAIGALLPLARFLNV